MSTATISTINTVLDLILIAAAIWMVITVRGLGGIIGKGLNWITIGALVLGIAHLLSTVIQSLLVSNQAADAMGTSMSMSTSTEGLIHRIFVLIGFVFLIIGFRQIGTIKK